MANVVFSLQFEYSDDMPWEANLVLSSPRLATADLATADGKL
jgi:hypothetical protein